MKYDSKVIAFSISDLGNEIITWEITVPKWLVGEINTHKVEIERNSASSRAVPTKLIIDMVEEFPCLPIWRYNQSGMTPAEPLDKEDEAYANQVWLETRDLVVAQVQKLQKLPSGRTVSKGTANRPLEFVMWTKIVLTMTGGGGIGINNFFGLRDKPEAQPEFQYVAHIMHKQYHNSTPKLQEWHIPYFNWDKIKIEENGYYRIDDRLYSDVGEMYKQLAIISSARCGRVTHYKQGQEFTIEEEMKRGQSFAENGHFSPLRHASRAGGNQWYGNMYGWEPISKIIMPHDYVTKCCERSK
jgi:hypothetical protein